MSFIILSVAGCRTEKDREQAALKVRIANSIEAARIGRAREGSNNEWVRTQYDDLIAVLTNTSSEQLSNPTIVLAYMSRRPEAGSLRNAIVVRWIANDPLATGFRVLHAAGQLDIKIPHAYVAMNEEDAQRVVMFYAVIPLKSDTATVQELNGFLDAGDTQVVLIRRGEAISRAHQITVIE